MKPFDALPQRIQKKINVTPDCWIWTAARSNNGYGVVQGLSGRKLTHAHRLVFEILAGPIPDGLHIDHLCLNKSCVNPGHLEPVTKAENSRRAVKIGHDHANAPTMCRKGLHDWSKISPIIRRSSDGTILGRQCRGCFRESALRRYHAKKAA